MTLKLCIRLVVVVLISTTFAYAQHAAPNLKRIKVATVGTADVSKSAEIYERWLDYDPVEDGQVSNALARSWGTPSVEGRQYALMQSQSGDDVYLRLVQVNVPGNYKALNSYGWNAIEIIVEDPDAIYNKLLKSPFEHLAGPEMLGGGLSTIRAVQFKGPSQEVFYFTTETGDRTKSTLLTPRSSVDRPFIMVLAGPDPRAIMNFYNSIFGTQEAMYLTLPIELIAKAQGMPADHLYEIGLLRLRDFSNSIEVDGYPESTGKREVTPGDLPPGVSITTFTVEDLDLIDPELFISPPTYVDSLAYGRNRTATIIGPAGELIELIEEK